MSDRERLLGIVVGCIVALMVLFGGYRMIKGGFDGKNDVLADRNQRLRQAKATNLDAKRKQMLVAEYQRKSLDANPEAAHLAFQHWLEKQVKEVGLRDHRFNFDSIPRTKKTMKELSYLVTGIGDINQVTEFLYRVHSGDTLHRVRTIDLQKHKDGIKLTARIDALSMPKIEGEKVAVGTIDESKLTMGLEEYKEQLSMRNLFAPANQAPEFKSLRTQTVEVGKNLSHKLEATDPEQEGLTFELDDGAPAWIKISKSGKLSGRPKEVGEHEFKVYVMDGGIPSKESVADFKVRVIPERVVEAPERVERKGLDEAKLAVLTAIVQGANDPTPQMCMYLRDKDESQYLQEGDDIEVGDWRGEVLLVNPDNNTVRLQTEEGEYELRLGDALSEARLLTKVKDVKGVKDAL